MSTFTPQANIISTKASVEPEQKLNITNSENNAQMDIEKKHTSDGSRENPPISIVSQQSDFLSEKELLRNELLSYIEELPVYKLKWTLDVLEQSKEPPANILFQQDSRNPAEAIIHEDNLRYNFYEHNVLDGYGDIGTLQCRSRYCLISITLTQELPSSYSIP